MIIKTSDYRQQDIAELNALLAFPQLAADTRDKILQEIKKIQAGVQGEKEAAHQIDFHYADSERWMIIHDLRLEYQGYSAQIDHLILNRFMEIYVCESKHFREGIEINAHGEFSMLYQGKLQGIPSPIEQNDKHIQLLQKIFDSNEIDLPVRLGLRLKPKLLSLILVANSARITRPANAKRIKGLDRIIKNEQLFKKINRDIDTENPISAAASVAKIISCETLQTFATALAALHQPVYSDWKARFGIADIASVTDSTPCCVACGQKVTEKVADFCRQHAARFKGKVYCYRCQRSPQAR